MPTRKVDTDSRVSAILSEWELRKARPESPHSSSRSRSASSRRSNHKPPWQQWSPKRCARNSEARMHRWSGASEGSARNVAGNWPRSLARECGSCWNARASKPSSRTDHSRTAISDPTGNRRQIGCMFSPGGEKIKRRIALVYRRIECMDRAKIRENGWAHKSGFHVERTEIDRACR